MKKNNFLLILFYFVFLGMACLFTYAIFGGISQGQLDIIMRDGYGFIFPMIFYGGGFIYYMIAIHKISNYVHDSSKDKSYIEYQYDSNGHLDDGKIYTYNEGTRNHYWNVFFLGLLCVCTQPISTIVFGIVLFLKLNFHKKTKIFLIILDILSICLTISLLSLKKAQENSIKPSYVIIYSEGSCWNPFHADHILNLKINDSIETIKISGHTYVELEVEKSDTIIIYSHDMENCTFRYSVTSIEDKESFKLNNYYYIDEGERLSFYFYRD